MKTLLVALLFCQVVVKIYSLSRFEDLTAVKLSELKREWNEAEQSNSKLTEKLAELFDEGGHGEDKASGVGPGPEEKKELKAVRAVVDALRKNIIPAVVRATKRRDEESEEYAGELVEMLKGKAEKKELKHALGKTVLEMHEKCDEIQAGFLKLANKSGLLKHLSEAMGPEDDLNELETIKEILASDKENEPFEALEKMGSGGKNVNPALKSFIIVNKLLSQATCGNPVKGLIDLIDKRVDEEDPSEPFPDLQDRILSFLGLDDKPPKPCKKREGLIGKNDHTPDSPKEKMLKLILEANKETLCKDVPVALRFLNITMEAIDLGKKIGVLHRVNAMQQMALILKIKSFMAHGRFDEAAKLVGGAALDGLRKGLVIGLVLKNTKGVPRPPTPPKPSGPKELSDLDNMLHDLEIKNDLRHGMK